MIVQYVLHEDVSAYEAKGWRRSKALEGTHHGKYSTLMIAPEGGGMKSGSPWAPEEFRKIAEMRKMGLSLKEMEERSGRSRRSIEKKLMGMGLTRSRGGHKADITTNQAHRPRDGWVCPKCEGTCRTMNSTICDGARHRRFRCEACGHRFTVRFTAETFDSYQGRSEPPPDISRAKAKVLLEEATTPAIKAWLERIAA